eukprot:5521707-Pleurochrysis_carterae.AAC.1
MVRLMAAHQSGYPALWCEWVGYWASGASQRRRAGSECALVDVVSRGDHTTCVAFIEVQLAAMQGDMP